MHGLGHMYHIIVAILFTHIMCHLLFQEMYSLSVLLHIPCHKVSIILKQYLLDVHVYICCVGWKARITLPP